MARSRRRSRSGSTETSASSTRQLFICFGLLALTVWVFRDLIHFQFVNFDDPTYVTRNDRVQMGLTWSNVVWAFTTNHPPYWHPVTWLSHMLDVQMFGLDSGLHHLTNVVLHVANAILLFVWLRRVTGDDGRSAFVAAIFAVHPLHVESVAWITERKDLLSALFWILTLLAYQRYVSDRRVRNYVVVASLFVLALMSKPMAVTLPLVLLLIDVWPLKRAVAAGPERPRLRALVLEKLPLFALAAASAIATFVFQSDVGAVSGLSDVSILQRVGGVGANYAWYLLKMTWPAHLAVFYPLQPEPAITVVVSWSVVLGLTAIAFQLRSARPSFFVGWMWFLIALLPVIGFIQSGAQAVADRFTYLPSIGLLIAVVWAIPAINVPIRRTLTTAAAVVVILACGFAAQTQASTWADSATLWRHAIDATGGSWLAFQNLGDALRDTRQPTEALHAYSQALTSLPARDSGNRALIRNDIGLVLAQQGELTQALSEFAEAERADASLLEPHVNRANVLASLGRFQEAEQEFRTALTLAPHTEEALVGLGSTLLSQGQIDAAIPQYEEATRLNPGLAPAWANLGVALMQKGRLADAQAAAQRALNIDPSSRSAKLVLETIKREDRR